MRPDKPVAVSPSRVQAGVMFAKKDVRRDFLSDLGPAMIASESNAHFDFPLSTPPVRRAPSNSSFRFRLFFRRFLSISARRSANAVRVRDAPITVSPFSPPDVRRNWAREYVKLKLDLFYPKIPIPQELSP
jgi:hypothetical protein